MKIKNKSLIFLSLLLLLSLIPFGIILISHGINNRIAIDESSKLLTKEKVDSNFNIESIPTPPEENNEIKILFAGDTMLARVIGDEIREGKNPFVYVKDEFLKYDLVIINLECVVSDKGGPVSGKLYKFEAPVEAIQMMKESGVNVVSVANNHVMDYGDDAFLDMLSRLDQSQISYFGGGENTTNAYSPLVIEVKDTKIGFVGYNNLETYITAVGDNNPGNAWFDRGLIESSIQDARSKSDVVIPFVHWGDEFKFEHNSTQENWAKIMIDSGSDIVVGGHPHVIQPEGEYAGKKIYYSLGNFVFDLMYQDAAKGNMLEIVIKDKKIESSRVIPIQINEEGFPVLVK
jgi:poly-gamma-glutamate capsule biosynthesis protein CapA/YwtB (metallophosphatase superfamily)